MGKLSWDCYCIEEEIVGRAFEPENEGITKVYCNEENYRQLLMSLGVLLRYNDGGILVRGKHDWITVYCDPHAKERAEFRR